MNFLNIWSLSENFRRDFYSELTGVWQIFDLWHSEYIMLEITAAVTLLLNKGLLCFKHWAWHFMNIIFYNFQNSSVRSLYFYFWLGRGWDAQKAVKKLPRASRLASCLRALEYYLMMIVLSKIDVTIFESWWRLKIDRLIVWDSATRPKV